MPKSGRDLLVLSRREMEKYVDMGHFQDPHTALPYLVEGHQLGYRLAESEKESEYEKLVEGLRNLPKGEIRSNGKGGQLLMPPEYVLSYSAIESLITEIEGGDNGKAE